MILPDSPKKLATWAKARIDDCRVSAAARAQQARSLKTWRYTGSPDGNTAIVNRLDYHIDRMADMIFSPIDLRFHIDFTHTYPKTILDQAEMASRALTREIERRDIDMQIQQGVNVALEQGSCVVKIMHEHGGISGNLTMPWQFGVYQENVTDLGKQEAVCETSFITTSDLWRRISHRSDRVDIMKRAMAYAKKQAGSDESQSYFHQVLLSGTSPLVQTNAPFASQAGGLVQVQSDPTGAELSPDVMSEMIMLHEMYVRDDDTEDYTTIQLIEPDILITPRYLKKNLFVPELLPYSMLQCNRLPNYIWGRSELADLMKLQMLLRDRMEDIKKLMSLQYDRFLAISGTATMTDELYDMSREAGFMNLEPGSSVNDLTPPMPAEAFADIKQITEFMDEISGFNNVLSGQGEPGVRAGNHAQMLMKTASPTMRNKALIIERQVADIGDKVFKCKAAKEAEAYWTGEVEKEGNEFLLSQLPDDYRVVVDSHSSSPIYEDDYKELAAFAAKLQIVGGEDLIDLLPLPRRDLLKEHLKEKKKAEALLIQQHPELLTKGHGKSHH